MFCSRAFSLKTINMSRSHNFAFNYCCSSVSMISISLIPISSFINSPKPVASIIALKEFHNS